MAVDTGKPWCPPIQAERGRGRPDRGRDYLDRRRGSPGKERGCHGRGRGYLGRGSSPGCRNPDHKGSRPQSVPCFTSLLGHSIILKCFSLYSVSQVSEMLREGSRPGEDKGEERITDVFKVFI